MVRTLVPNRFFDSSGLPALWDDEDLFPQVSQNSGLSVSEDDKNVYIEAAVPGVDPKDIDVTLNDGILWIRGEMKKEEKDAKRKYYRQASSSYSYRVAVPSDVDQNVEPEASYKNGVMNVTFAKSPKSQPKKIAVKSAKK